MSNSFNISVAPEIAALEIKVDTIDTEVDAIRAVDIPATDTLITAVDTVVDSLLASPRPGYVPSNDIIISSTPNDTTNNTAFETVKSFLFSTSSVFRITYDIKTGNAGATVTANIFKNTIAFGTERSVFGVIPSTFTEDLRFETGDFLELMIKTDNGTYWAGCEEMKITGIIATLLVSKVTGS